MKFGRSIRGVTLVVAAILSIGCGNYYSAEIQGFVIDSGSNTGINGATVRLYLNEPVGAADDGFFARTSTATSNNLPGYFRNAVVWRAWFASFGPEGDSGTVYLGITHDDYAAAVVSVPGVLSDAINTVQNVRMDRISFEVPTVKGRVVDVNGDGVNGVRMVLDLASTTDNAEDYVTVTGDESDGPGYYVFDEVEWRDDANAGNDSDDEEITLTVQDGEWDAPAGLAVTLTSGQERVVATDIAVTRQPRTEFATNVAGGVFDVVVETQIPRAGVGVRITLAGSGDIIYAQTGADGRFAVRIEWTDTVPRDFDGDENDGDGDDTSIPEGEDGLLMDIDYDTDGNSLYGQVPNGDEVDERSIAGYQLKSWINPNFVPDWDPGP
ncbi:MAG: hypothetical protein KOO61_09185 [Spirochaetales bacterium]|nr:hypothetical protein [Spirochaetales bacterium]